MKRPLSEKSSVEEIRNRFDQDVERFSQLQTGQQATMDAPLVMELITQAALAATPHVERCLDIGCGAGNQTMMLLQQANRDLTCDLCDLSKPMVEKAVERVSAATLEPVTGFVGDFRDLEFEEEAYDVLLAGAVLHHLREEEDWETVFEKIHRLLRPGGSVWISDLVFHAVPAVQERMWQRYAEYLIDLGGKDYQEKVFAYIDEEDSPRSVTFQLELLRKVGFAEVELLHKNSCFAAFGAVKSSA